MRALLAVTLCTPLFAAGCGDKTGQPIQGIDAAQNAGSDAGSGSAATVPLVVASSLGVLIWNDSAGIATNVAPDVVITSAGGDISPTAVVAEGDRLYVAKGNANDPTSGSQVAVFSGAHTLTSASTTTALVPIATVANRLRVDSKDDLWVAYTSGQPQIDRFAGASTIASTATASTTYTHPNKQLASFAYEPTSNRLFAGQISGAGTLAWNTATTLSGSPTFNFALDSGAYFAMADDTDHDRLYAGGLIATKKFGVAIWPTASTLAAPTAPVTLTIAPGADSAEVFIPDLVVRDDVLAVIDQSANAIEIYTHASAITTDRAPDFTITDSHLSMPSRLAIDASGRLYVVGENSVVIFGSIATAPTFIAELTTSVGTPVDLTLVE